MKVETSKGWFQIESDLAVGRGKNLIVIQSTYKPIQLSQDDLVAVASLLNTLRPYVDFGPNHPNTSPTFQAEHVQQAIEDFNKLFILADSR